MEAGLELDDDVFFKDLSKQISLLIMDDDEDSLVHRPSVNLQAYNEGINQARQASSFVNYDHHHHQHQITSKRDQSKGTGVFIPRSNPRRKNVKQGRFTGSANKPQISNNNVNLSLGDHSFNLRRF